MKGFLVCALLATMASAVDDDGMVQIASIPDADYVPEIRKITNEKKIYSTINEDDKLEGWPSAKIKKSAGKSAWGDWLPKNGMDATVVHSWGLFEANSLKHLLKITDETGKVMYCVMGEAALEGDPRDKGVNIAEPAEPEEPVDESIKKVHDFHMGIHDYKEKMHYLLFIDSEDKESAVYRAALEKVLEAHPDGEL
jgi:hypothetical protein